MGFSWSLKVDLEHVVLFCFSTSIKSFREVTFKFEDHNLISVHGVRILTKLIYLKMLFCMEIIHFEEFFSFVG